MNTHLFQLFIDNIFMIFLFIIYICLFIFLMTLLRNSSGNKKLFSSITNILKYSSDAKAFISRANIVFEKYIQKNAFAKKEYTSLQDVLENIIYYLETRNKKELENYYGVIINDEEKNKVYSFYQIIKTDFPYDILNQHDKDLIINLIKSIDNNDTQTTENVINQLIKELFNKTKKIHEQAKTNIYTIIISIIGIFLTIFFGIQAIIK